MKLLLTLVLVVSLAACRRREVAVIPPDLPPMRTATMSIVLPEHKVAQDRARYAEAVFTAQQTLEDAQAFYTDLKARAASFGRDPAGVTLIAV